jgi:hypothetical protein
MSLTCAAMPRPLDRIFSDDVIVIVPGMRVMTKADAVGMFTSGRMKFDKYDRADRWQVISFHASHTGS